MPGELRYHVIHAGTAQVVVAEAEECAASGAVEAVAVAPEVAIAAVAVASATTATAASVAAAALVAVTASVAARDSDLAATTATGLYRKKRTFGD